MQKSQTFETLKPFLIEEVGNDEWDMRCPLHGDRKRSARVNFEKGLWNCFAGCGGGRLTGLLRRMKTEGQTVTSKTRKSTKSGKARSGRSVTPDDVSRWHRTLLGDAVQRENLLLKRGINEDTIREYELGWDQISQAFTIPVYEQDGTLFNVRKYRPNAPSDKKIFWAVPKDPDKKVPLYPESSMDSDAVVLAEGETDALMSCQVGVPAVTGTAGANTWRMEWSERFKGKQVFIAYDRDSAGEKGARQAAEHLEPFARDIFLVKIPLRKPGADISDYLLTREKSEWLTVLKRAKPYQVRKSDPMDMQPVDVSVMGSFDAQNVGRAQSMEVLIQARSKDPFSLPKVVHSTCSMDAGKQCAMCPMMQRNGEHDWALRPSSRNLLAMVGTPEATQAEAMRKEVGAAKCQVLRHEVTSYQSVEQLYVRPSWEEESGDFTPRRVLGIGKHDTLPSQTVRLVGTTWPEPKEQRNEFMAWTVEESENAIDEFRMTPDLARDLRQFQPEKGQTPLRKLWDMAADLESHVTRIYGRRDLHIAIDLVYHSVLAFPFRGGLERRGWLDALIVGDTRTGKSEAAKRMGEHYRVGKMVNCEAATFSGIVGGLEKMGDKEWAVNWGAVPMNDRRLVILDEVSGLSYEQIQQMSDIRSAGTITLQKIRQEQAWARTRLLWLGNPRDAGMDQYTYGVMAVQPLIGNREDIARFDFAMALTSSDIKLKDIHQRPMTGEPQYTSDECHSLVLWAWSRQPDDVEWIGTAEEDVMKAAAWLGDRYVDNPPLLQSANAHVKVARLAVALAACTFSTDRAGRKLLVTQAHVSGALKFLDGIYSRDTFGYRRRSEQQLETTHRAMQNMNDAKGWLDSNEDLLMFLLSVESGAFRREMVEQILNRSREESNGITNTLFSLGLVSPNGQSLKMTPTLHKLLREIQEERMG